MLTIVICLMWREMPQRITFGVFRSCFTGTLFGKSMNSQFSIISLQMLSGNDLLKKYLIDKILKQIHIHF